MGHESSLNIVPTYTDYACIWMQRDCCVFAFQPCMYGEASLASRTHTYPLDFLSLRRDCHTVLQKRLSILICWISSSFNSARPLLISYPRTTAQSSHRTLTAPRPPFQPFHISTVHHRGDYVKRTAATHLNY